MAVTVDQLLPYDPGRLCPACGGGEVGTRFEPSIDEDPCWYDRKYRPVGKWPEEPYIHRTCNRCRYEWPEAPAYGFFDVRGHAKENPSV